MNTVSKQPDNRIVVDIADIRVSNDPKKVITTYALGSCIAVILYEPVIKAGGMIHYMLPLAKSSPDKARLNPAMFADSGVPLLFEKMYRLGCKKQNLVVKVAGGGQSMDEKGMFNIGKRNYTVLRKIFWQNKVIIDSEDVGGNRPRTVTLEIATGIVSVTGKGDLLLL